LFLSEKLVVERSLRHGSSRIDAESFITRESVYWASRNIQADSNPSQDERKGMDILSHKEGESGDLY